MERKILALFLLSFLCHGFCSIIHDEERQVEEDMIEFKAEVLTERILDTEYLTCEGCKKTIWDLEQNLEVDIYNMLSDLWSSISIHFDVIDPKKSMFMNKTVQEINTHIGKEVDLFHNIATVTKIKLDTLIATLHNKTLMFESKKDVAIRGLHKCFRLHPTPGQRQNTHSCVVTYKDFLQKYENDISKMYNHSPCMRVFEEDILTVLRDIALRIKEATERILHDIHCNGHPDEERPCLKMIPHLPDFRPYVTEQVKSAQILYTHFNDIALKDFSDYLRHEESIKKTYKIKPKPVEYFKQLLNHVIEPNLLRLKKEFIEYEGYDDCHCQDEALSDISEHVARGAKNLTHCYDDLVYKHYKAMDYIRHSFLKLANDLKHKGNVAILKCIPMRNCYAHSSIFECFDILTKYHNLDSTKTLKSIEETRRKLESYLAYFKENGSPLTCITEEKAYAKLFSESSVYRYSKCVDEECRGYPHERRPPRPTTSEDPCNGMYFDEEEIDGLYER